MARYYRVGPSFWGDHADWTDDVRLAALYVLTSPHRSTEGLFRMPLAYAAADLGWLPQRFAEAFARLVADGFVEYDETTSVCLIVNALKWQAPENPNQATGAVRAVAELPKSPLEQRFIALAETHSERLANALREGLPERFGQSQALSPSPSLRTTPPQPPASGGRRSRRSSRLDSNGSLFRPSLTPPDPPAGKRKSDLAAHQADLAVWQDWAASPAGAPEPALVAVVDDLHRALVEAVGDGPWSTWLSSLHAHRSDDGPLLLGVDRGKATWVADRFTTTITEAIPDTRWQLVACDCSTRRLESAA